MANGKIPFSEKNTPFRAILDLATGCYPAFVFGGKWNDTLLPVFHFHEVTPNGFKPFLHHLREHGYQTLSVEDFLAFVCHGKDKPPRSVLLCFDDAWTSLWTVAAPLLRQYGMQAVTFAIPGRVERDAPIRPTLAEKADLQTFGDDSEIPFANWAELRELDREGVVQVESHTYSHHMVPISTQPLGVWSREVLDQTPLLSRPVVVEDGQVRALEARDAPQPRFLMRSGMSDARSIQLEPEWLATFQKRAAEQQDTLGDGPPVSGSSFLGSLPKVSYTEESIYERDKRIRREIIQGKELLEEQLGRPQRVFCFPWAVAGKTALQQVEQAGYAASFGDRLFGKRYVRRQSDRFSLMRLKHQWILKLPPKK